jgi:hypothetical protein
MKLSIYQIILGIVSLISIAQASSTFIKREKGQTFFKFISTIVIWGTIFSFAIFPRISHLLSAKFGLGENLNTLIFIGFVVVFMVIFKLLHSIERLERDISEIVRKEALEKLDREISK